MSSQLEEREEVTTQDTYTTACNTFIHHLKFYNHSLRYQSYLIFSNHCVTITCSMWLCCDFAEGETTLRNKLSFHISEPEPRVEPRRSL